MEDRGVDTRCSSRNFVSSSSIFGSGPGQKGKNWGINFRHEEGGVIKNLAGEASLDDEDQIQRQFLRGDETQANRMTATFSCRKTDGNTAKTFKKEWLLEMVDDKLERDELQRAANYEAIKSGVKAEVGNEIAAEAQSPAVIHTERVGEIAGDMRHKAIDEVAQTEREVERGRFVARISQIIDYIFFLVYGLLAIRLLLALFAARQGNGFVQFVQSVTDPIYAPFKGIVASPTTAEGFTLALPIIIALVAYMLLHFAINGFLRIFARRKVAV